MRTRYPKSESKGRSASSLGLTKLEDTTSAFAGVLLAMEGIAADGREVASRTDASETGTAAELNDNPIRASKRSVAALRGCMDMRLGRFVTEGKATGSATCALGCTTADDRLLQGGVSAIVEESISEQNLGGGHPRAMRDATSAGLWKKGHSE